MQHYMNLKPHIMGIRNGKIRDHEFEKLCFDPARRALYDPSNGTYYNFDQTLLKCTQCCNEWRVKDLWKVSRVLCPQCKEHESRPLPKARHFTSDIVYNTNFELKFLKWCKDKNIEVSKCDEGYFLPQRGVCVVIKDNRSVIKYGYKTSGSNLLIYPKKWLQITKELSKSCSRKI